MTSEIFTFEWMEHKAIEIGWLLAYWPVKIFFLILRWWDDWMDPPGTAGGAEWTSWQGET